VTAHISCVKTCIFGKEAWFSHVLYGFCKCLEQVSKGGWLDQ